MARRRARAALGVIAAAAVSGAAHRGQALSRGGAIAATAVGGAAVTGMGFRRSSALVTYFVSSSVLGRLPVAFSIEQRRGNQRDAVQVLANGGVAALLALAAGAPPERFRLMAVTGFGGAVAAAAADTWATEIGSRFGRRPRSIVTLTPVPAGTSGGVTLAGLAASVGGATLIAGVLATGARPRSGRRGALAVACALGGVAGALADSVLGATVQEVRWCDVCGQATELRLHRCGRSTRRIRGARWCDNDTVNGIATAVGAMTAVAIAALYSRINPLTATETQPWPR